MTRRLEGRTAVVTGAGTGIGRAIALRLAAEGALVAALGRRMDLLGETVDLAAAVGGEAFAVPCDVTDAAQVREAAAAVAKRSATVAVLVNNAGTGGPNPLSDPDDDRWHDIIAVNLTGMYRVTKELLPRLPSDGTGRVIGISSVLGRFGVPGYTAYCAAKSGVIGFTKALALELAPRRITVNSICPGWVETDMAVTGMSKGAEAMGTDYATFRRKALAAVPLGRILAPEEVASLAAWLASDEASGMTGQSLGLNAGSHMD